MLETACLIWTRPFILVDLVFGFVCFECFLYNDIIKTQLFEPLNPIHPLRKRGIQRTKKCEKNQAFPATKWRIGKVEEGLGRRRPQRKGTFGQGRRGEKQGLK